MKVEAEPVIRQFRTVVFGVEAPAQEVGIGRKRRGEIEATCWRRRRAVFPEKYIGQPIKKLHVRKAQTIETSLLDSARRARSC